MDHRLIAIAAVASAIAVAACGRTTATAGFWYDDGPLALPAPAAEKLGGLLTGDELASIKTRSRAELERAFAGMRLQIVDNHAAFWRVEVSRTLRGRGPLPNAGESLSFGWLGGAGAVSFDLVVLKALHYAPPGASRQVILDAIGRGIGRVAAHELAHQMIHSAEAHNPGDENSYEYPSPDRAAQYYGELHWTTARPLLEQTLR